MEPARAPLAAAPGAGGERGDRICRVEDVEATARHHGVAATLVDGLAHMLMLEPEWKSVAQSIADFVDDLPRRA